MEAKKITLHNITPQELELTIDKAVDKAISSRYNSREPEDKFITREEACAVLKINKTTLWKHTKQGHLKSYGFGKRVLYKYLELLEAIKPLKA